MDRVLIVEDSKTFASLVKKKIEADLQLEVVWAACYAEAVAVLEQRQDFLLALLDLNLPDAPNGEIVDYVIGKKIPPIIFTGEMSDELRDYILSKNVIDYVPKKSAHDIESLLRTIRRIRNNRSIKVLVADDSLTTRNMLHELLAAHKFIILTASGGKEALELLEQNPDVRLLITDYSMPDMDGFELTRQVRRKYRREELGIIAISAHGNNLMAARFIKDGANDFLTKPFFIEEFYCRVNNTLEIVDYVSRLKEASDRDYLTGLHNRRYMFEVGERLYSDFLHGTIELTVAILDIDHFKPVNDTYGHDAGDFVLQQIARLLKHRFSAAGIVARYGGEEFIVLLTNTSDENAILQFEGLRQEIENTELRTPRGQRIKITISIGISSRRAISLEQMISAADTRLYQAKNSGRNRIVLDDGISAPAEEALAAG